MSIMMNNYERCLVNYLQKDMSKKDAENALYEIRENLYGDRYSQIKKRVCIYPEGSDNRYPNIDKLVDAYNGVRTYHDIYDSNYEDEQY